MSRSVKRSGYRLHLVRRRAPWRVAFFVLVLLSAVLLPLLVRAVGQEQNRRVPAGGINESGYVELNGSKQWISIYGENLNNPVLLYLHGGPGSSTSAIDYAFTRKWADIFTVVTWDQRSCGKSYDASQNGTELTYDLLMRDGLELTKYLIGRLGKEKITLLGHSWGSCFGANLALAYPQYYERYIGTGQLVDMEENERMFREAAAGWVGDDAEGLELLAQLQDADPDSRAYFEAKNRLMERYGYGMMKDGTDYSMPATVVFNPYYSLADYISYLTADPAAYMQFTLSDEFARFSLIGRTSYQVPYYNINGDMDYQTNHELAQTYFDSVTAPVKGMYLMANATHGLLESRSGEFSRILHELMEAET